MRLTSCSKRSTPGGPSLECEYLVALLALLVDSDASKSHLRETITSLISSLSEVLTDLVSLSLVTFSLPLSSHSQAAYSFCPLSSFRSYLCSVPILGLSSI